MNDNATEVPSSDDDVIEAATNLLPYKVSLQFLSHILSNDKLMLKYLILTNCSCDYASHKINSFVFVLMNEEKHYETALSINGDKLTSEFCVNR